MRRALEAGVEVPGAIVIGAGIAGLFTALKLAPFPALILSASPPGSSGSSIWAQGGIAAALGDDDSAELHAADTLAAGARLGDPAVAAFVAREAAARIEDLVSAGAPFDRMPDGKLALAREAAHSRARIVHVSGDRAGAEVMRALANKALACPSISFRAGLQAIELATEDGRVIGVYARDIAGASSEAILFRGRAIVLASGGIGGLFAVTTNPADARGEGLGMAARAGALIADPEFVQFHPTAMNVGRDPAPLATEALRGEGALLLDECGHRFMPDVHAAGELAPRDVVARAIFREIARGHRVFLDCRAAPGARFASHFPTVYQACRDAGFDPANTPIPVAPAAHYHMGGIATGFDGGSSLRGLWCVGECACTGLHGANRLASNSLLEALVFGARAAESIKSESAANSNTSIPPFEIRQVPQPLPEGLRAGMMRWVGLERDELGLKKALAMIAASERACEGDPATQNILAAAKLIVSAALARPESIGAHFRVEFPTASDAPRRSFLTFADAENHIKSIESTEPILRAAQR
jgi:L-aspartate oxidase